MFTLAHYIYVILKHIYIIYNARTRLKIVIFRCSSISSSGSVSPSCKEELQASYRIFKWHHTYISYFLLLDWRIYWAFGLVFITLHHHRDNKAVSPTLKTSLSTAGHMLMATHSLSPHNASLSAVRIWALALRLRATTVNTRLLCLDTLMLFKLLFKLFFLENSYFLITQRWLVKTFKKPRDDFPSNLIFLCSLCQTVWNVTLSEQDRHSLEITLTAGFPREFLLESREVWGVFTTMVCICLKSLSDLIQRHLSWKAWQWGIPTTFGFNWALSVWFCLITDRISNTVIVNVSRMAGISMSLLSSS